MFDRIYFPNLFSKFSTVLILALLLFAASCTTSHKVKNSAKNAINLDTISINATKEKGIYHGSETRLSDIIHTRIEVKFDWAKQYLYGKAYITAKPYFYPLNTVRLNARGMDINEVDLLNGETKIKANYVYKGDVLLITLDKEYSSKDTFKLFIDYTAKPNELKTKGGSEAIKDDKGLYFINPEGTDKNKPMQIWTQGETQSNSVWFPCVDSPNEKMTNEVFITVDRKYTTLSNGALFSQTENADGTRTDYWRMSLPHSTYLVMMAIGEFSIVKDHWRDREVNYYMEKEFEPYAKNIFGNTPEMIEAFSKKLGVNYPWNKYSQIIVRDYVSGAMENTTATLHGDFMNQTDRELLDRNYEDVISHELFHQWFGDLVTCESWSNIPLNESFADYGEYIWREFKYGRDEADALRHKSLNKYFRNSKGQQTDIVRYFYNKQEDLFDVHTYEKGGCVLHMLRKYVGDEAFYTALKLYLETNKFGNAEMADLRMAFEKVTGEDLNWFFNQWFFASGHPELVITHQYDTTTQKYTVTIEQK
ncbi:MAG: M1 family metallopeptidase, partial [Bacteroidia bacterium]|nr:M1 family metallopeptidase [Bacteroidia bacterium]